MSEPNEPDVLPRLRGDLHLERSGLFDDGTPAWTITDPLRNRHFKIDRQTVQIIAHWQPVATTLYLEHIHSQTGLDIPLAQFEEVRDFLIQNQLALDTKATNWRLQEERKNQARKPLVTRVFQTAMFSRFALGSPQQFLDWSWPVVAPLFSKAAVRLFLLLALIGFYLVAQQWQQFQSTLISFFSLEGMLSYLLAMAGLKIVHELGHAFMAKKYGVAVPQVGVAFMFAMPILFTDTGDGWRLPPRQRLMIDLGGIFAELMVAVLATLLWCFLPDGNARSIAFMFASLSWITSLAINLNPFMRFDGYYVLSDALGIENLQTRSLETARWGLRKFFLGLTAAPPERQSRGRRRFMIGFAWATIIYRLFLYLGIAWMVYAFAFKLLGIALMFAICVMFLVMPVVREMRQWHKLANWNLHTGMSTLVGIVMLIALFVPWSGRLNIPAVAEPGVERMVFSPGAGRLERLHASDQLQVTKGDVLAAIGSNEIAMQSGLVARKLALIETRMDRAVADQQEQAQLANLKQQYRSETAQLEGLRASSADLIIRSPFDGVIRDMNHGLHVGRYVPNNMPLFSVLAQNEPVITGYVEESLVRRLANHAKGRLVFEDAMLPALSVVVASIVETAAVEITPAVLADNHGGGVSTLPAAPATQKNGISASTTPVMVPSGAWFKVIFHPIDAEEWAKLVDEERPRLLRGTAFVSGSRESLASKIFRRVAGVVIREAGF